MISDNKMYIFINNGKIVAESIRNNKLFVMKFKTISAQGNV